MKPYNLNLRNAIAKTLLDTEAYKADAIHIATIAAEVVSEFQREEAERAQRLRRIAPAAPREFRPAPKPGPKKKKS